MALPTGLVGVRTISGGSLGAFFFFFFDSSWISSSGSCSGGGGGGSEGKGGNSASGGGTTPSVFTRPNGRRGGGIKSRSLLAISSANIFFNFLYKYLHDKYKQKATGLDIIHCAETMLNQIYAK